MVDKDAAVETLLEQGVAISGEPERYRTYAWRIKLADGPSVFLYDKGGVNVQGNLDKTIKDNIENRLGQVSKPNSKVFVAYGHDKIAKEQLSSLLNKLSLEPLFLDELAGEGNTIVEQLEKYIPQCNFGIALITPDDYGHLASAEASKALPRARQNVVLEIGMLYMKLGRTRTVLIVKDTNPPIEIPSDLDGVLQLRYSANVSEIESKLIREMKPKGYVFEGVRG